MYPNDPPPSLGQAYPMHDDRHRPYGGHNPYSYPASPLHVLGSSHSSLNGSVDSPTGRRRIIRPRLSLTILTLRTRRAQTRHNRLRSEPSLENMCVFDEHLACSGLIS